MNDTYYIYVDETGNLDMDLSKKDATPFFGIGTATFLGDHRDALWEAKLLRIELESQGIRLPKGFHAHDDKPQVRHRVIDLIKSQAPTLDATLLRKDNAYSRVRSLIIEEPTQLYRYAWYHHFSYLATYKIPKGADVVVIAGTLGSKKEASRVRDAIDAVCNQHLLTGSVRLCNWDSPTTWPLQVADYASWSAYRKTVRGQCEYQERLHGCFRSLYRPWGMTKK